jgi:hypothetical protein
LVQQHLEALLARANDLARQRSIDLNRPFDSRILRIQRFSDIFDFWDQRPDRSASSYGPEALDPEAYLTSLSKLAPMLLLHAPGGFGKSAFLLRILLTAMDRQVIPFYVDFASSAREPNFKVRDHPTLEEVFEYFSPQADLSFFEDLRQKCPDRRFLILVDSINERLYDWAPLIDQFKSLLGRPNISILIADRMTDRKLGSDVAIATTLPLSAEFIKKYIGSSQSLSDHLNLDSDPRWLQLLEMPFFLALSEGVYSAVHLEKGDVKPTRVSMLKRYFERTLDTGAEEIRNLGDFGLSFYSEARGTEIDEDRLKSLILRSPDGESRYKKLLSSGALVRSESTASSTGKAIVSARVRFRHQSLHDFLVGYRLAWVENGEDEALWRSGVFDTATLHTSSFEALDYTVEALTERQHHGLTADRFLTEVYDWNYGAVIQAVSRSDGRPGGGSGHATSDQFRTAIYALNAEKLFDHFTHTKEATKNAFRGIPSQGDLAFLSSSSIADLIQRVAQVESFTDDPYWTTWQELFCRTGAANEISNTDLTLLWKDPVLSWTAANVFRRGVLSDELQIQLRRYYELSRSTSEQAPRAGGFQWRVVHLLGRSASDVNIDFLLNQALDIGGYFWVRYGAIRSYIEAVSLLDKRDARRSRLAKLASALENVLLRVGDDLQRMSSEERGVWFRETTQLRRQVFRCRVLNDDVFLTPEGWSEDYGQVYRAGVELFSRLGQESEAAEWQTRLNA